MAVIGVLACIDYVYCHCTGDAQDTSDQNLIDYGLNTRYTIFNTRQIAQISFIIQENIQHFNVSIMTKKLESHNPIACNRVNSLNHQ